MSLDVLHPRPDPDALRGLRGAVPAAAHRPRGRGPGDRL